MAARKRPGEVGSGAAARLSCALARATKGDASRKRERASMTHQGGPTPSRRRLRLAVPIVAAMLFALLAPAIAYAVHDLQFQLDGDVRASTTTSVGGSTQTLDWASFIDSLGHTDSGTLPGYL